MTSYFNATQPLAAPTATGMFGSQSNLLNYPGSGMANQTGYQNVDQNNLNHHPILDARSSVKQLTAMIPEWKGHFDLADVMMETQENTLTNVSVTTSQLQTMYDQFKDTFEFAKSSMSDIFLHQDNLDTEMNERCTLQHRMSGITVDLRKMVERILGIRQSPDISMKKVPSELNSNLTKGLLETVNSIKVEIDHIQNEVQLLKEIDVFRAPIFIETVLFSQEMRINNVGSNISNLMSRAEAVLNRDLRSDFWTKLAHDPSGLRKSYMDAVGMEVPRPMEMEHVPNLEMKKQIVFLRRFNSSYQDPNFQYMSDLGYNIKDLLTNTVPNQNLMMPGGGLGTTNLFGSTGTNMLNQPFMGGQTQQQQQYGTGLFGTSGSAFGSTGLGSTTQPSGTGSFGTTTTPQQTGGGLFTTPTTPAFGSTTTTTPAFGTTGTSAFGQTTGFGTTTGTGTTPLGGTTFPSTTPTGTGLFGSTTTPTTSFGTTTGTTGTTNLFGQTQQQQPFGSTGQFGSTTTGLGGSFGTGTSSFTSGSNLFGTGMGSTTTTQQSTGLFGTTTTPGAGTTTSFGAPSTTSTGLFGSTTMPTTTTTGTGLFGSTTQPTSTGLFGSTTTTTSPFGTTNTGTGSNLFSTGLGSTPTAATGSLYGTTGSAFGSTGLGTTTQQSGGLFGGQSTSVFGSNTGTGFGTTTGGGFGTTGSTFGTTTGSTFGSTGLGSTSLFGSTTTTQPTSTGLFGNTNTSTGLFGSTPTSTFGSGTSGGLFGSTQPKSTGTELALYNPSTTTGFGTFNRT